MEHAIRKTVESRYMGLFIRLGYIMRGFLYGSLGLIALFFSFDKIAIPLSTTAILQLIRTFIFGQYLLIFLIAGLIGYVLWGIIRASMDIIFKHKTKISLMKRAAYLISAISYTSLLVTSLSIFLNLHINQDSHALNHFVQKILILPYGKYILYFVAALSIFGGIYQIVRALKIKDAAHLSGDNQKHRLEVPFMIFAKIGISVRGIVFIMIGFFLYLAALHTNPADAKNISEIFLTLKSIPFGPLLLQSIGTGLVFFGLSSIIMSYWIDLP